ncbi:deoxyribonuclease IV [candidate division KSB1 bacterium 4572_119]|nr:MAG: deoxyribonuclease IV [candidate division KSB1 bacterium 4572_119]
MLLGAHVSIAGGIDQAVSRGEEIGSTAIQIFTKNQRQWNAKPLLRDEIDKFKKSLNNSQIQQVIAHSSYLVNLCNPDKNQLQKSRESFIFELKRSSRLGISGLVFHPGAHLNAGEKAGIQLIADSINYIIEKCPDEKVQLLLETTAGQGSAIGFKFEQLREIIDRVQQQGKIGVCLDTCHIFAAGYDIRDHESFTDTIDQFDQIIGLEWLQAIHLNDSKKDLGTRVDRHERIGLGKIGIEPFRQIMKDARFREVPKILEVPGGMESYKQDIELLKSLMEK